MAKKDSATQTTIKLVDVHKVKEEIEKLKASTIDTLKAQESELLDKLRSVQADIRSFGGTAASIPGTNGHKAGKGERTRRGSDVIKAVQSDIVAYFKSRKIDTKQEAAKKEDIAKEMGVDKTVLDKPLADLVKAHTVEKYGQKRASRYYLA